MKMPEKIKIGGKVYDVEITENISLGDHYAAEINYTDLKIRIRPGNRQYMEANFWHEAVHGILAHLGYYDHDEKKVEELAEALYMVFKDNPAIFATGEELK